MPTLSDLRTRLRDRLAAHTNDTFLTSARLDSAVNTALQKSTTAHDWPWLQTTETITTVIATDTYDVADDFLRTNSITVTSTGAVLEARSMKIIRQVVGSGSPADTYAIYGSKIYLRPIPSAIDTLTHDYYRVENTLLSDSDFSLVPDPFADGIVEYAAYLMFRATRELDKADEALSAYRTWVKDSQDNLKQTREPLRISVRPGSEF